MTERMPKLTLLRGALASLALSLALGALPAAAAPAIEAESVRDPAALPADGSDRKFFSLNFLRPENATAAAQSLATATADQATDLIMRAMSLMGVRYKRGGNSPETGLDCSGLVNLVFRDTLGLVLPRRSEEISRVGEQVNKTELKPGDLVFYNTVRRAFSHVGIYLGEGRFLHAPASGGKVRIEDMNQPYWTKRFNGARRVTTDD